MIRREWAMPNKNTFSIKPIKSLIDKWVNGSEIIVDPFANNSSIATITNDLNPQTEAEYHMESVAFGMKMAEMEVKADAILLDPPYSPRQISECYKIAGLKTNMQTTQNSKLMCDVRRWMDAILKPGGIVISFGWNSGGFGKKYSYILEEILMVNHGGSHNDTICVVERKPALCNA